LDGLDGFTRIFFVGLRSFGADCVPRFTTNNLTLKTNIKWIIN